MRNLASIVPLFPCDLERIGHGQHLDCYPLQILRSVVQKATLLQQVKCLLALELAPKHLDSLKR